MRFLSRIGLISSLTAVSLLSAAPLAFADHVTEVLGDTTDVSHVQFPGIAAGPGFILPDSGLYPVDQLVQEIRLVLAFVPEQQAVVQKNILGERIAEAKVEIGRGNLQATDVALAGAEKAARGLSSSLADAGAKGRGSAELAESVNQTLGEYRAVLSAAASQAPTSLAYRLDATSQVLLETKVQAEDELPGDQLAQAVTDDLQNVTDRQVLGVQTTANSLLQKLGFLDTRTNSSAMMMDHNSTTSARKKDRSEKKVTGDMSAERQALLDERKQILSQIQTLMQQLRDNQKALQDLQKTERALREGSITPTLTPSPEPSDE